MAAGTKGQGPAVRRSRPSSPRRIGGAVLEDRFDEMRRNTRAARSRSSADAFVLAVLGEKTGGYFVEVGAGDGVNLSNTHLLETVLGWRGLLIEPNPLFHASIRRNRKAALETRAAYSSGGNPSRSWITRSCPPFLPFKSRDGHDRSRPVIESRRRRSTTSWRRTASRRDRLLSVDTEGSGWRCSKARLRRYRPG